MLQDRINRLETEMQALKESAESDTKSSMGDKYETGREMINLEKGKIAEQLGEAVRMSQSLNTIDTDKVFSQCALGSLVTTESAAYFMATSIGKVKLNEKDYFVISPVSPIGQQLLDKKVGESINFGGRSISILGID